MTLDQAIGQLFAMGLGDNQIGRAERLAIRDGHVGSVWFTRKTQVGQEGVRQVADAAQALATDSSTGGVRFFVAANQEGGRIQALRGAGFSTIPSAVTQGTVSPDQLEADARTWGAELRSAGVNLDFAPVADVVPTADTTTNQPIGILEREYGNDADTAGSHAAAFVRGMTAAGVATTAKHFPGLGRVVGNTDFTGNVVDDETTADDALLGSFRQAIDAGVPFVMVALATYELIDPDRLAVFSPIVIRDVLRGQLGFSGVVMSDDLGGAVAVADVPVGDRAIDFLTAGGDLVVVNNAGDAMAMAEAVRADVASDPEFGRIVDAAVNRVLAAKEAAGLLPCLD
jgi:beta-N-acetylhexosaminidase